MLFQTENNITIVVCILWQICNFSGYHFSRAKSCRMESDDRSEKKFCMKCFLTVVRRCFYCFDFTNVKTVKKFSKI